jgi:hypothetical protein
MNPKVPKLNVEGMDDVSVISNLLRRHGIDTDRGNKYLAISGKESDLGVLDTMCDAIRAATGNAVGFVIDIDTEIQNRWQSIVERLRSIGISTPESCPAEGYIDRLPEYSHPFGIWLMPDCKSDNQKLEDLVKTLLPRDHPLWPYAKECAAEAKRRIDEANVGRVDLTSHFKCFGDPDRIKAELRTWLAWQRNPGVQFGAAINDHILGHDSPEAKAFLRWLKKLFNISELNV